MKRVFIDYSNVIEKSKLFLNILCVSCYIITIIIDFVNIFLLFKILTFTGNTTFEPGTVLPEK